MAVQIDTQYEATIKNAAFTVSQEKKTPGLGIVYNTSDGDITKVWYITAGTIERLKENLGKCFGITSDQLKDKAFMSAIGKFLTGRGCSITTEAEKDMNGNIRKDARGNPYAAVSWMNPSRLGRQVAGESLVGLFGGEDSAPAGQEPPPTEWGGEDSGVPF